MSSPNGEKKSNSVILSLGQRLSYELDSLANVLESKGLIKEAAEIDVISNTLETLAALPEDKPLEDYLTQRTKEKPGWLANKVEVVNRAADGRELGRDVNRVYTSVKPTKLLQLWKEGPDGNWYLQNAEEDYTVAIEGSRGYLEGMDGSRTFVPGLKIVTDL